MKNNSILLKKALICIAVMIAIVPHPAFSQGVDAFKIVTKEGGAVLGGLFKQFVGNSESSTITHVTVTTRYRTYDYWGHRIKTFLEGATSPSDFNPGPFFFAKKLATNIIYLLILEYLL